MERVVRTLFPRFFLSLFLHFHPISTTPTSALSSPSCTRSAWSPRGHRFHAHALPPSSPCARARPVESTAPLCIPVLGDGAGPSLACRIARQGQGSCAGPERAEFRSRNGTGAPTPLSRIRAGTHAVCAGRLRTRKSSPRDVVDAASESGSLCTDVSSIAPSIRAPRRAALGSPSRIGVGTPCISVF
jgi:hypothetical protein